MRWSVLPLPQCFLLEIREWIIGICPIIGYHEGGTLQNPKITFCTRCRQFSVDQLTFEALSSFVYKKLEFFIRTRRTYGFYASLKMKPSRLLPMFLLSRFWRWPITIPVIRFGTWSLIMGRRIHILHLWILPLLLLLLLLFFICHGQIILYFRVISK